MEKNNIPKNEKEVEENIENAKKQAEEIFKCSTKKNS